MASRLEEITKKTAEGIETTAGALAMVANRVHQYTPNHLVIEAIGKIYAYKIVLLGEFLKTELPDGLSAIYPAMGEQEDIWFALPGLKSLAVLDASNAPTSYLSIAAETKVGFSYKSKRIESIVPSDMNDYNLLIDKHSIELVDLANNNVSGPEGAPKVTSEQVWHNIIAGLQPNSIVLHFADTSKYAKFLGEHLERVAVPPEIYTLLTKSNYPDDRDRFFDFARDINYRTLFGSRWDFFGLRNFGSELHIFKKR